MDDVTTSNIGTTPLCACGCGRHVGIARNTCPADGYVKGQPYEYIQNHRPRRHLTHEQRIQRWLARCVTTDRGCWLWTGAKRHGGYGNVMVVDEGGKRRNTPLHRVVYEHQVGPIPDGLVIDHLCRVPACCNPAHLEPVTQLENQRRGLAGEGTTHCPRGHAYDEANTYRWRGARFCRACKLAYQRSQRASEPVA